MTSCVREEDLIAEYRLSNDDLSGVSGFDGPETGDGGPGIDRRMSNVKCRFEKCCRIFWTEDRRRGTVVIDRKH